MRIDIPDDVGRGAWTDDEGHPRARTLCNVESRALTDINGLEAVLTKDPTSVDP